MIIIYTFSNKLYVFGIPIVDITIFDFISIILSKYFILTPSTLLLLLLMITSFTSAFVKITPFLLSIKSMILLRISLEPF